MRMSTREYYEDRILHVQMYIQDRLDEDLLLEELAEVACFSPFHFHRIFSGMVGESIREYIRRLKVERAALELRHSSRSVQDIAMEAGYKNQGSFTRIFSNIFGIPPREYRENFRNGQEHNPAARKYVLTIERQGGNDMDVSIKQFEQMTVAFVRHTGPYRDVGIAWKKLCSDSQVRKMSGRESLAIGICYDDPDITEEYKIRYDACITVKDDFVAGRGVAKQKINGGEYAVLVHKGRFEDLLKSYRWIYGEWLPGSGREVEAGPSLEIYLTDPDRVAPEDMMTEIRIPLKAIR